VTYDAGGDSQPVRLGSRIEVPQRGSTSYDRTSTRRIDGHVPHPAQIDLDTVINHGAPACAVCSTADGDFQILLPGEPYGGADVSSICAAHDDRWSPIDGAVPDDASLVITRVTWNEYLSGGRSPQ